MTSTLTSEQLDVTTYDDLIRGVRVFVDSLTGELTERRVVKATDEDSASFT